MRHGLDCTCVACACWHVMPSKLQKCWKRLINFAYLRWIASLLNWNERQFRQDELLLLRNHCWFGLCDKHTLRYRITTNLSPEEIDDWIHSCHRKYIGCNTICNQNGTSEVWNRAAPLFFLLFSVSQSTTLQHVDLENWPSLVIHMDFYRCPDMDMAQLLTMLETWLQTIADDMFVQVRGGSVAAIPAPREGRHRLVISTGRNVFANLRRMIYVVLRDHSWFVCENRYQPKWSMAHFVYSR